MIACAGGPEERPSVRDSGDTAHADTTDTTDSADTEDSAESGDSAPVDADADGSPAGVDCDDADPTRFPGAADRCDGVDQDCDGQNAGVGSCSEVFLVDESDAHGWWVGDGEGWPLALLPAGSDSVPGRRADFDGDGIDDLRTSMTGTLLLRGSMPWPETSVFDSSYLGYWLESSYFGVAGDFDGDGSVDLFVTSPENGAEAYREGAVYLLLGPPSRWPTTRTPLGEMADAHWTHENGLEGFGSYSDAADVTGDGLSDIVVLSGPSSAAWESDPSGYVHVLPGRTTDFPMGVPITDEEPVFTITTPEFPIQGNELNLLPDIDGDGIAELSFRVIQYDEDHERSDTLALFPTDALTHDYSGQDVTELWEVLPKGDAVRKVYALEDTNSLGDADGDGYGDVAVRVYDHLPSVYREEVVCMGILRGGANLSAGTVSDALGGRVCLDERFEDRGEFSFDYEEWVVPDVDADGVPDLFLHGLLPVSSEYNSTERKDCVVPTAQLPASGAVHIDEVRKFCFGGFPLNGYPDLMNLDADDLPDLLIPDLEWDRDRGRILVIPGFELPWGDPTRW